MKYGHFSQSEVNQIALLLEKHGILFNVSSDSREFDNVQTEVKHQSPFNYLLGASLNNDILMIEIQESEWEKINQELREKLFHYRIFPEVSAPEELLGEDLSSDTFSQSHRQLQNINKVKMVGVSQILQILLLLLILGVYLLARF